MKYGGKRMKQSFMMNGTEFGVDEISVEWENDLLSVDIIGSKEIFDKLCEDEDGEWSWALETPHFYLKDVPYKGGLLEVDEEMLCNYEIAVYMMEHNDFCGTVEFKNQELHISGVVDMMGEEIKLEIHASCNN